MTTKDLCPKKSSEVDLGTGKCLRGEEKGIEVRPISEEDYEKYRKVMQTFGCKTFGDYVKLYCSSDVEFLSVIFERFIETCLRDFGLDPSKSYTSAGFFCQAMVKMTKVKLKLLTDPTKYAFFENSIRGGVAVISNHFADANNPYLKDFDPKEKRRYIMEWDANSVYASVMVQELPMGEFRWIQPEGLENMGELLRNGESLPEGRGASLCVDLDYPKELHDFHNDYPLAPEKVVINGVEKLAPNLGG